MKTSDFHYDLPPELIASEPLEKRSASRLMCLNEAGDIAHKHFFDLPDLLKEGDLLVFNNSKVIPARLYGQKITGGRVEILVERIISDKQALVHIRGGKALKHNAEIILTPSQRTYLTGRNGELFELGLKSGNWEEILKEIGHIPLPPYMEREDRLEDRDRYQTVYAKHDGSVAAPTAGLHFDNELLKKLAKKGINSCYVTLHVGAGTFQPVRVEDISEHKMHAERFEITQQTCDQINKIRANGGRIIAVGTTSARVLESAARNGEIFAMSGETDIFITPGYNFQIINGLITNFHLPESTLLMLVSALMKKENILNSYRVAVAEKYRFFSYGDAMLLL